MITQLSAYGLSLKIGDTYLGGPDYNVLVMGRDDPGWSGLSRTVYEIPFRDGGVGEGGVLKPVQWSIPCRIHADTEAQCRQRFESLCFALYSENDQQLIFDSNPGVYYLVSATEASAAKFDPGANCMAFELGFSLSDPTGYAVTETEKTFTITTNPQSFSVLAGDLENGSIPPWPTWILEAGASVTTWTLTNATTGQAYSDDEDLTSGQFVKLDSKLQERLESADGVTYTRDNSSASGTIPRLKPRTTNTITVTGISSGTLTVRYRERYAAITR